MKKVVVKILQGSVVTQTTLSGLTTVGLYIFRLQISKSIHVPKIMQMGLQ